tara:strand:+ start:19484 stop:19693 length:210 start_codon:yes stop_codon:yes gene_type:complete
MKVKTVFIDRDGVRVCINESDYIPGLHTLWGAQSDEKDDLIDRLKRRGIEKDRRTSVHTLRKLLEESQE